MSEAVGLNRRAREESAQARSRAKSWEARQAEAARAAEPVVVPPGANHQQRTTFLAAMGEVVARERQSKVHRGWQRIDKRRAPLGCIPVCALWGAKMAVLVVDRAGALRLSEGGKAGSIVTVSEAVAIAGRR